MKFSWKGLGRGLKVALDVAIDLNDAHVIKVKELDKVKTVRDIVQKGVRPPSQPPTATIPPSPPNDVKL